MALTTHEKLVSLAAMLKSNPLTPETPAAVLQSMYARIDQLTDELQGKGFIPDSMWGAIPQELRQMFLMAGFAAIGTAINQMLENQDAQAAEADPQA